MVGSLFTDLGFDSEEFVPCGLAHGVLDVRPEFVALGFELFLAGEDFDGFGLHGRREGFVPRRVGVLAFKELDVRNGPCPCGELTAHVLDLAADFYAFFQGIIGGGRGCYDGYGVHAAFYHDF